MAVEEDKLTGEDDEALGGIAVEGLIAAIEQLYQFAGIRSCRLVLQLAFGVESNAGLCCVGNHKAHLWLLGKSHVGIKLCIGVHTATDNVDALQRVHWLAVLTTLQVHVIQAVLTVQPVNHTTVQGLDNDYRTIEIGLLVHVPDNPINERTEEITLTELNHLFRHYALRSEVFV